MQEEISALTSEHPLSIRGAKIDVLDHGYVRLVDWMGGDDRIVQSARVSYGDGTKTKREDAGLIRYLIKNKHWTPVEKVVVELEFKLPIFVARQFVRHRTQSLNEVSARYSILPAEFYIPDPENVLAQDTKRKQSRGGELEEQAVASFLSGLQASNEASYKFYQESLDAGVARELARMSLPLNIYTAWFSTMNLRNLFNFLELRLDTHAQFEARKYAEAVLELCRPIAPVAFEAWEESRD